MKPFGIKRELTRRRVETVGESLDSLVATALENARRQGCDCTPTFYVPATSLQINMGHDSDCARLRNLKAGLN